MKEEARRRETGNGKREPGKPIADDRRLIADSIPLPDSICKPELHIVSLNASRVAFGTFLKSPFPLPFDICGRPDLDPSLFGLHADLQKYKIDEAER